MPAPDVGVVKLVEGLQIDVVRRRLGQGPRPFQFRYQGSADVLRVSPQVVEPVPQRGHFFIAGHANVELGVASEPGQREIGRADHRRSGFGVVVVPAQVRLGVEGATQVGSNLHLARGHHVPQLGHRSFRSLLLGESGDSLGDPCDGLLGYLVSLAAPNQCVRIQTGLQRLLLLEPHGNLLQHLPVGAPHQDAHLAQPRQVVGHRLEPADEEVPDGDVRPGRTAQHLLQPG